MAGEKWTKSTSYEKSDNGFIVGIDLENHKDLIEMGKLVEKKDARNLFRFQNRTLYFWSKQKLSQ